MHSNQVCIQEFIYEIQLFSVPIPYDPDCRSTIADSLKNNSKNKKCRNYEEKNKNRINYFCNLLVFLSHLRSFLLFFAKKRKLRNSVFWEANFIFSTLINICSPGDEPTIVLWYTHRILYFIFEVETKKQKKSESISKGHFTTSPPPPRLISYVYSPLSNKNVIDLVF